MVYVEIVLNVGNYFCTLQLGFWKFLSSISLSFIIISWLVSKMYYLKWKIKDKRRNPVNKQKNLRQKWPQKMHLVLFMSQIFQICEILSNLINLNNHTLTSCHRSMMSANKSISNCLSIYLLSICK